MERAGVDPSAVQEVYMGNVLQANSGQAPARQAALFAGEPRGAGGRPGGGGSYIEPDGVVWVYSWMVLVPRAGQCARNGKVECNAEPSYH